jgi:hypothetical protein
LDPELIQVMRNALEEVMTRVPSEHSTSTIKAYLAECILKTAVQERIAHDQLIAAAADQIQVAISLFSRRADSGDAPSEDARSGGSTFR